MKKGPLAEDQVVKFLRTMGFPHAERRVQGGINDRGDVAGLPGVMIEVKNRQSMELAQWLDEALKQADLRKELPLVWHKRRGKGSPGDWYVTTDGWTLIDILREWTK